MSADDASREHEPTQKRLDDARARGEVVQSADLTAAIVQVGFLAACAATGGAAVLAAAGRLSAMIASPEALSARALGRDGAASVGPVLSGLVPLVPLLVIPAVAAALALAAQRAVVFAPDRIAPKLSRIDPLAALRHRFGTDGLFDFAKGAFKLAVISGILAILFHLRSDAVLGLFRLPPARAMRALAVLAGEFLAAAAAFGLAAGAIDYLWQRHRHLARNRMSRQELIEEFRQSEGDPQLKMTRRQRAQEIALNSMMRDVPSADVIVVNPTHYAVALRWKRGDATPPVCVAKGVDAVAARIREAGAAAGVPVREDPPTARALYATVEIGREIRPEHYRAVAVAIRFAEEMRRRARARGGA